MVCLHSGIWNENANAFSMDKISGRKATFVGISDSDRVFGRKGNGIRFGGAGEHMVVKDFVALSVIRPEL